MSGREIPYEAVEAAANAISECSGMRFDGFWSRVDELEPEDEEYALKEARAALEAAAPHMNRTITTVEELDALPEGTVLMGDWATYQRVLGDWVTLGGPSTVKVDLPAIVLHAPQP